MANFKTHLAGIGFAVAMTVISVAPVRGSDSTSDSLSAKVDQLFAQWNRTDSPGFAVGIVHNGKLIHSRGYGMANLDHSVPIDGTTVFEIASVTKSFTTACFALLLDQGQVSLDDDVRQFVPELPKTDPPIQVRHLLRCESGFKDFYLSLQLAGWNVLDAWTKDDVLQLITAQRRFDFKPGERFAYSNSDFFLLALIVERVTGKSLADFAHESVFRPLQMDRTFYATDSSLVVPKRAMGYQRKWRTGQYHEFTTKSGTIGPFGLKTTLEDLFRWDQNFYDNKLPAGPHFNEFLRTGCLIGNRQCLEAFPETTYRGAKRHWYTGGMPGFMAQFIRFPQHDFSIMLLCNVSDQAEWSEMTKKAQRMADLYLGEHLQPIPPPTPRTLPEFVELSAEQCSRHVGFYRRTEGGEEGFMATVSLEKDRLVFTDHFSRRTVLAAISSTQFRPANPKADETFEFTSSQEGERMNLTIKGDSKSESRYEPLSVVKPTTDQLADYVGQFYSEELLTTYHVTVTEGRLYLRINNHPKEELAPMIRDEFVPKHRLTTDEGRVFRFARNREGKVMGMRVRLWRGDGVFQRVR